MALCHPDNAIWPDPSVIDPADGATAEEVALLEQRVEIALGLAWSTLQVLSAYQIAICPITVRPSGRGCAHGSYFIAPVVGPAGSPFWPTVRNGQWLNVWCGHNGQCSCDHVNAVTLPGPVGSIDSVVINGVTLDPEVYRVDNGNSLVRQDGAGWPLCQNFDLPLGEDGVFSVTYYHGATADLLVRYAAGILADEYLKAIVNPNECRLPAGTTQVVRQGISFELQATLFDNGRTGIAEVDAVIQRYNPFGQRVPPSIFSLDRKPARQQTYTPSVGS